MEELQEHQPRRVQAIGCHHVQQPGVHDDRIAWLASEFLDLDVDAVDVGAFGQVAVDAAGIAVGLPQVAQPGMQCAQVCLDLA